MHTHHGSADTVPDARADTVPDAASDRVPDSCPHCEPDGRAHHCAHTRTDAAPVR